MAKKDKTVQIYPKRREIDPARMADALLHLVDRLSPEDKARFASEGKRIMKEIEAPPKAKGSAA